MGTRRPSIMRGPASFLVWISTLSSAYTCHMPYRIRKPYIIVNGQRLVSPTAVPQRLPFCDQCDTLAADTAPLYTELAPGKWWKWFSFPRFSCQEDAFMGCEKHRVEPEIHFLDGRIERLIRLPLTRWQRLTEWDHLLEAGVLAVAAAIFVGWLFKL